MKTKKGLLVSLLAILLLMLSACNVVIGSGGRVTESRSVSDFDSISLNGSGDVIIEQGGEESLTIETNDNIMQYVTTEVRDGTLHLAVEAPNAVLFTRIVFTVGVVDLSGLEIAGSGSIKGDGIETDQLEVSVGGSGNVELEGTATRQTIDIAGSGRYKGGDLRSETADVSIAGSGKATVWATDGLDVSIAGSGTVEYYGSPTVNFSSSGSGNTKSLGEK